MGKISTALNSLLKDFPGVSMNPLTSQFVHSIGQECKGTECPVCTWGGVEEAETTAPAAVTLCYMFWSANCCFYLNFYLTILPIKIRTSENEKLIVQRGWETTNWLIFLLHQHLKKTALFLPFQIKMDRQTLSTSLILPMCFSVHLPDTSLFSKATYYQLVDGSASWTQDFFLIHTISGFTVWSNVCNTN